MNFQHVIHEFLRSLRHTQALAEALYGRTESTAEGSLADSHGNRPWLAPVNPVVFREAFELVFCSLDVFTCKLGSHVFLHQKMSSTGSLSSFAVDMSKPFLIIHSFISESLMNPLRPSSSPST